MARSAGPGIARLGAVRRGRFGLARLGASRRDLARQVWHRSSCLVWAWRGRHGIGRASRGWHRAWFVMSWQAAPGRACRGNASLGKAGVAGRSLAGLRRGIAGHGLAGAVRLVLSRLGLAGAVRCGFARLVLACQGRLGMVRLVSAFMARQAWLGMVWLSRSSLGTAGKARHVLVWRVSAPRVVAGKAGQGVARHDVAVQAGHLRTGLVPARHRMSR
jgi:hypothetical protein